MKRKVFLYLLIVLAGFISCDDKRENGPDLLPDAAYEGENLALLLNGNSVIGKKVGFVMPGAGHAVLLLHDILPGEKEISLPVTLTNNEGRYSLEGEDVNPGRTLCVSGEVGRENLHLEVSLKITSEIAGKWRLSHIWDKDQVHSFYMEIENDRIAKVKLPNLTWSRYPDPEEREEVIIYLKDTPGEGFSFLRQMTNAKIEDVCNVSLQGINFREDGVVTVTYTDWRKPAPRVPETTRENMIRYNIVGDQIWFLTDEEPARCFPLNFRFVDSVLKINLNESQLSSFTALSSCLKSFIRYLDEVNALTFGYTSEESVREFVDVTLYKLIDSAESCEWGVNLKLQTAEE